MTTLEDNTTIIKLLDDTIDCNIVNHDKQKYGVCKVNIKGKQLLFIVDYDDIRKINKQYILDLFNAQDVKGYIIEENEILKIPIIKNNRRIRVPLAKIIMDRVDNPVHFCSLNKRDFRKCNLR